MRTPTRPFSIAVSIALGSILGLSSMAMAQEEAVVISLGEELDPALVEVATGETITFRNDDDEPHQLVSEVERLVFDTGVLEAGAEFEVVFGLAGEYAYVDVLDETDGAYAGTIVVTDGSDALVEVESTEATIVDFAFSPEPVEVVVGSTVTWTNADPVAHTVTATEGAFASDVLVADTSFSQTFDEAGTFEYFCSIHPVMVGSVVVSDVGG